ncbi:MAG: hypothetical protein EZS28_030421 [Streblomastix strix]|uniref:Uncharacterized protein n=1 Tax=Streblomastix strix TaxID=222440 RepID=A0A5J4UUN4_9EUKA|nr:MAG: hypothetical protein EZS28_030421 [Streblomastix strix]
MINIKDTIQFLGASKKIYNLMNHSRFSKIVEKLSYPISIINKEPDCIGFIDIDGVQKMIDKKKDSYTTISLTQVFENEIWSFETMFMKTKGFSGIGIVRDSYDIPANADCYAYPHTDHIAAFCGGGYQYPVWYKGKGTYGNDRFKENQILRVEFDSFKAILILFIDNVQQPVYFFGIKEKVRFIISMFNPCSTCIISSLKKLQAPTSKHLSNEKAVKW